MGNGGHIAKCMCYKCRSGSIDEAWIECSADKLNLPRLEVSWASTLKMSWLQFVTGRMTARLASFLAISLLSDCSCLVDGRVAGRWDLCTRRSTAKINPIAPKILISIHRDSPGHMWLYQLKVGSKIWIQEVFWASDS